MGSKTKRAKRLARNMEAVGIDLGEQTSYVTLWAHEKGETFSFPMTAEGYALLKERIPPDARIVFESSGTAYPFHRQLQELGFRDITVAHPKELAWIVKSKKKTDKVDSIKLAKLHSVGMIPEAHLLNREDQIFRDLLLQRVRLSNEIGEWKSRITSYLKREGLWQNLPPSTDSFSVVRRKAMSATSFGDERDLVLSSMLDRLDSVEKLALTFEQKIRARARESEEVKLLMSIPGAGYYLASLLCSYIGDVRRFPDADHLASFFGIVPAQRESSSKRRMGRMSKEGPSEARWALGVMVDTVAKYDTHIAEYYNHAKARTGRGKLAHVLTAKKLVRMVFAMLSRKEPWKWERTALTERKLEDLETD